MKRKDFPAPEDGFVVTHFITVTDIKRSVDYYASVFGGTILMDSGPGIVKLANTWIIFNTGGGPTDDKPEHYLESPTPESRTFRSFLNIRVSDIQKVYKEWTAKGAQFITEPKDHGAEIRCYITDPDGYIIEVGQATGILDMLED